MKSQDGALRLRPSRGFRTALKEPRLSAKVEYMSLASLAHGPTSLLGLTMLADPCESYRHKSYIY
jgi:hypothetical protein